jgi:hypothetical protein
MGCPDAPPPGAVDGHNAHVMIIALDVSEDWERANPELAAERRVLVAEWVAYCDARDFRRARARS